MAKSYNLIPLIQHYLETDPALAARQVELLDKDTQLHLLNKIQHALAITILSNLSESVMADIFYDLPPNLIHQFMDKIDDQRGLNILRRLPAEKHEEFIQKLSDKKKKQFQELLSFPEDSAGRYMSTKFTAFHYLLKVKEAIKKIRVTAKKEPALSYIYVVNSDNYLIGILNMRDLLLADEKVTLESVMRKDVFSINCFAEIETVAQELTAKKFFSAPVVDSENHLLGIIKAEKLMADIQEEATEDLQKMFGAGGNERAFSPLGFSLKNRLPWLHINLATAFLAASVVALFEGVIAKITILAVFLPVVAGQGGNAGAQSLAVVMRGLVMREIPQSKVKRLLLKEAWIGIINGLVIGLVTAGIAWIWKGNPYLGLVIGLGMIVNLFIAGLAGSSIPLMMKALGLDPAQASNIILTTITDVVGFFAFLGFALLFQDLLI